MSSRIREAVKELKQEIKKSFPDAIVRVLPPVADADKLVEVVFPNAYSQNDWDKLVTIQSDMEWKYHVTFGVIPMSKRRAAA